MSKIVALLALCVVCAILKAALLALVAALMLALLVSFIRQPGQTLLFLASLALIGLANAQPLACIIAFCVIGVAAIVAGARQKAAAGARQRSQRPLLLTDGREQP